MFNLNQALQKSPKESQRPAETDSAKETQYQATRTVLESEKFFRQGVVTLKDLIAPASLEFYPSHGKLNNKFIRTLFVLTYPRYINVGWFSNIINFNGYLDIAIYLYPLAAPAILKQLRNKVGNLEAQLSSDQEKGSPRDPMRETALRDIENLRDAITQGTEKFFLVGLYATVYADTLEQLDDICQKIEYLFSTQMVEVKRAFWQTEPGFNSTLPLGVDELAIGVNLNTSPAASSFPFISSELTSDNGILYGINRHNNSLILFDRFSLPNANSVVFATSGAGKSYAIKLEILRSLMLGAEVIVIDPEREYAHLCDAVGGAYINISLNSENRINPFDLPKSLPRGIAAADVIRSAAISAKGLLRIMLGSLSAVEDSILDQAIVQAYAKRDITPESDWRTIGEPPQLTDLIDILEGTAGAENLILKLKKYSEGTFAGLFNNQTNVDLSSQLVVFSVRDLEDELRPEAIYNIVNFIWNAVRGEMKKRILVIDEAWWLMQYEDSAKFIYALVKRCRKYYLGITTITQDVNDFLNSPYGQAIVSNSSLQMLMRQSPSAIETVGKTFMLTESERYLLLESAVGEGIFFAGSRHAAIKIVASYIEDQIITSDPRQLLEIEASKREFEEAQERGEV